MQPDEVSTGPGLVATAAQHHTDSSRQSPLRQRLCSRPAASICPGRNRSGALDAVSRDLVFSTLQCHISWMQWLQLLCSSHIKIVSRSVVLVSSVLLAPEIDRQTHTLLCIVPNTHRMPIPVGAVGGQAGPSTLDKGEGRPISAWRADILCHAESMR